MHSVLYNPIAVSASALSNASPTLPIEPVSPARSNVSSKWTAVYCLGSTGHRNTGAREQL
jgi:hypothetical protein